MGMENLVIYQKVYDLTLYSVPIITSGCTLIKVEVLKKLEIPWYKSISVVNRPAITSDTYICQKLREIGVDVITDTGVQCLHVDRQKGILYGHPEIIDYEKNEIKEKWREYFAI